MENNVSFDRWSNDGTVVASVGGKKYTYIVDAAHLGRLQRMAKHRPFTALNDIKGMVNRGQARMEEPEVLQPRPVQRELF